MGNNKKMVDEMIHPDYREDALNIISSIKKLDNGEALYLELEKYYKENNGNIFCLHLDYIKSELINNGILSEDENKF